MVADKILIIGPSWVGDMVLAHSLFQTLKQHSPHVQIDVVAPAWTLPLLDRMPEITEKIPLPFQHGELALSQRYQFGRGLRGKGYQQAILLVNSFKSAIVPWAANIPIRTGFLGEFRYGLLNDICTLDKTKLPRTVDRFVTLGLPKSAPLPTIPEPKLIPKLENAHHILKRLSISTQGQRILGLCPGAEYGEAKRWPVTHFAELANSALAQNWQVWLFGSDKDTLVTAQINALTHGRCIDWGGNTTLGEAIDLIAMCTTVVSNDSGLMHVAAALEKKVVAIYGSSDPHHTPPMRKDAVIAYLGLACSPCFKRECPLKDADAHMACLKGITPQQISTHFL
jgi:heptosyltransferase II